MRMLRKETSGARSIGLASRLSRRLEHRRNRQLTHRLPHQLSRQLTHRLNSPRSIARSSTTGKKVTMRFQILSEQLSVLIAGHLRVLRKETSGAGSMGLSHHGRIASQSTTRKETAM
ncbi:MAG: hypothetical protein WCS65_18385 [Verrucomicrobiae bacterium]